MRVVLIRPRMITTGVEFVSSQTPLNLCYLAAVARQDGAQVQIWDYDVERFSQEALRSRLLEFRPDVVGITLMTPTAPRGGRLARVAKQALPDVLTVAGGPHPSALPEQTLEEFPGFDIAVFGEGELTFREIVEIYHRDTESTEKNKNRKTKGINSPCPPCLCGRNGWDFSGVRGIAYRTESGVVRNEPRPAIENLDLLPFPARDLLRRRLYRKQSYRGFSRAFLNIAEVSTSRGCPNACIFCAIRVTHGRGARFRSAENVTAELDHLVREYGTNHVVFLDDTFTLKPARLREIMRALKELSLTWNCTTRVDAVDEDLLRAMVAHGCRGVAFGVESGSPRILELIGKGINLDQVRAAFRAARRAGVANIEADFILGVHPSEREHDIEATQELIAWIRPTTLFVAVGVPYPGTPLWEIMQDDGLIEPRPDWEEFLMYGGTRQSAPWRMRHFAVHELRRKQHKMLKKFYFSPGYVLRTVRNTTSIREFLYYLKSGLSLLMSKAR